MRTRPMPISACSALSRRRTSAWTVTSRAVVGSSATMMSGFIASAMAIMMRWRWPPENWWGYLSRAASGSGMPTRRIRSRARSAASMRVAPWTSMTSRSCQPTVQTGFRWLSGSWKIMAMRLPLMARRSAGLALRRSRPSKRIWPVVISPGGQSIRFRIADDETDLPEPLSPRMARVSPRSTCQLTFLTASTMPRAVWKRTERLRTSSRWVTSGLPCG